MRRLSAVVGIACLSLVLSGGAGATGPSTVGFEDDALDGVTVTSEYSGVTFGKRSDFGPNAPNSADCGAPDQFVGLGHNSQRYGLGARCAAGEFTYTGTYAHFAYARQTVSVWVGNVANVQRTVVMTPYGIGGNPLPSTSVLVGQGANWNLAITRPSVDIGGVLIAINTPVNSGENVVIDDLSFDNAGSTIAGSVPAITTETGQAFNGIAAHFTDNDPTAVPGDFAATIDWGDGTPTSPGSVIAAPGGGYDVTGSHSWSTTGSKAVNVTLNKPAYGRSQGFAGTATVYAPGATPTPTPTPTPSPAPSSPPETAAPTTAPAKAAFTPATPSVASGSTARFDASRSVTAGSVVEQYRWDLNGDGKAEAACDGATPVLTTRFNGTGSGTVGLSVVDAGGRVTQATEPFSITAAPKSRPRAGAAAIPRFPPAAAYRCGPSAQASPAEDITAQGGPPPGCYEQIAFGIIEAIGCLQPAKTEAEIPTRERAMLSAVFTDFDRAIANATAAPKGRLPTEVLQRDPGVSTKAVRINGLDFVPDPGATIVVVPSYYRAATREEKTGYVVSSSATVKVGSVPLLHGKVRIPLAYGATTAHLVDFDLKRDVPFLQDLPLTGTLSADLVQRATALPANVMLPGVFTDPNTGKGLSASVTLRATNRDGILLDGIEVRAPYVFLGGVLLQDLYFRYARADESYLGSGKVVFPPNGDAVGGEIRFQFGKFKSLTLFYEAGARSTGIQLGAGVALFYLKGAFRLNPTELDAEARIGIGAATDGGCPVVGAQATINQHFAPGPYVLDARGQVQLKCIPIAQGYIHVDGTGYVSFGGGLDYDFKVFSLKANVAAQYRHPHFQFDGDARACIGDLGCIGGEAVISDLGMGFCADFGFTHAGAGFFYPPATAFANPITAIGGILANTSVMFTSCNVGQYRSLPKAQAAQAGGSQSFDVVAGQPALVVGVKGNGAMPQVKLVGPGGRTLQAPADGALRTANEVVFHNAPEHTEYFLVGKPAAGRWTVEPLPGSPAVAEIRTAAAQADPVVRGSVRKLSGGRRSLSYSWTPVKGQSVTLVEKAPGGERALGTASPSGRGTIVFAPSDAAGSARRIVAAVTQDGRPLTSIDLVRFSASPARLARPGRVRVRRRGKGLAISWGAVAGARGYAVSVTLSDGRRLVLPVRGRKRAATVAAVSRRVRGTVRVAALKPDGRPGPGSATVRVAPGR